MVIAVSSAMFDDPIFEDSVAPLNEDHTISSAN